MTTNTATNRLVTTWKPLRSTNKAAGTRELLDQLLGTRELLDQLQMTDVA